jgi:hypothetical protein
MYIGKINDPLDGANLDKGYNLNNLHYTMFHAQYLTFSFCQYWEEDFIFFYYIHIRKTDDPPGSGQFGQ